MERFFLVPGCLEKGIVRHPRKRTIGAAWWSQRDWPGVAARRMNMDFLNSTKTVVTSPFIEVIRRKSICSCIQFAQPHSWLDPTGMSAELYCPL